MSAVPRQGERAADAGKVASVDHDSWRDRATGGGPDDRSHPHHRQPDVLFPRMATPHCTHAHGAPTFRDDLSASFINATAFSPTATRPRTAWATALLAIQCLISLRPIARSAVRAVTIPGRENDGAGQRS